MLGFVACLTTPVLADTLTDVAGRTVELDLPAKRVLLGEGRQVHVLAALKGDDTFKNIVGWRDDLIIKDPDSYAGYLEKFPEISSLPRFGYIPQGKFDLESAIKLAPDVLTMNIESKAAIDESGLEQKAEAAGIKLVYVDFRSDPERNSNASIEILGKLFGAEEKAKEFVAFRNEQIALVTDRLAQAKDLKRPTVFIEQAPGIWGGIECCRTFGPYNFGEMIDMSGGHNIGADVLTTTFGTLNPEQLIVANPDMVMVTGSNWAADSDVNAFVPVGRGADPELNKARLKGLMERSPFAMLPAVENGKVYAVWHQFYGVPYDFVPIQQFAKWFQPDLFKDLDPEQSFRTFHERFLPIAYKPGYFASLDEAANK
ncbi:ABC transporter substrate-binding protein [Roseibium suaedae]|nr:ABC transporter substrate-binding protein [Roseibium suaedae]